MSFGTSKQAPTFQVSESGSQALSTAVSKTAPSGELAPAASKLLTGVEPLSQELSGQLLEGLTTGGVGARIPLITRAVEESKTNLSRTLAEIEKGLTQKGLTGTPFGERILAGERRAGEFDIAGIAPRITSEFLKTAPGFVGQAQQTGISGLSAPTTESISRSTVEAFARGTGGGGAGRSTSVNLCCFTFIATHGYLHPIVRKYRDSHMTTRNRRGYYWLSDRLVPLIKQYKLAKYLVKLLMVSPMTSYGKYYYRISKLGVLFTPITAAWLLIFDLIGWVKKETA